MTVDQIEVLPDKTIQVRYRKDDGEFHREVYGLGQRLVDAPERVKRVAQKHWDTASLESAGLATAV
jgi:hypothetical protein